MFDANELWKKRLGAHLKETGRYMRLIFNDHLAFALLFFIAAFAYFYQQWLENLPEGFPVAWVMGIVLGLLLTHSPVRTLLQEADTVFLLPAEHKMNRYFLKAFWYSFFIQLYYLALGFAALSPLYLTAYPYRGVKWLLYLAVILIVLKIWNLLISWWLLKERDIQYRRMDAFIRLVLNIFVLRFFLLGDAVLYVSIMTIIFVGYFLWMYQVYSKKQGVAWDMLIEKEEASMQAFYRLANMFTDVPHLKKRAKKRHLIVRMFTQSVPFKQQETFAYLYRITFVRSSDYLGMYVRLFLIAIFFIFWIPNIWFKLVFALLFIYLSGFQLISLWNHHKTIDWIDLYPLPKKVRRQSLQQFLQFVMLMKTFILGVVMFWAATWQEMLILWIVGGLFTLAFVNTYVKSRLERRQTV
ncbi:ABC-2 type transport system permease protein [Salinibacillus kushneri]|uniref:ABC-2 type transport system permease protein n=1 Tax=Salinibacillus kushneri TaxID=237682 RepID=A0A1I0AY61_9BACI|nr:ABC transporter permease [Salinibacillus kushneri]SES99373.1 ABC-2 type transport system permease protein [Salinibacillus kushneri]